ncbi:YesL family protein [Alkalihalobacillus sp. 1P02AB]|uniref:YesL family protein n=1 Tax=Alkalihalobacillus sp. 1P02AB TaxID=3132260 RepID=UPI0039A69671
MNQESFMSGFYKFSMLFVRLAYINLLWLLFIALGLIIFGFFPATIAMFTVVRQWVQGNLEVPVFSTFFHAFKKEFLKGNMLGLSYLLIGFILYIDILYFSSPSTIITLVLYYFFWVVTFIYLLLGFFLFPVYVQYQNKWWRYYKSSLLIMVLNPLVVISYILMIGVAAIILRALPGLIPLFSGSALAFGLMLVSYRAFVKVEDLQEKGEQKEEAVLKI